MRPDIYFCMILCDSAKFMFRKNSGFILVDGCGVSSAVFSSLSSQSREK